MTHIDSDIVEFQKQFPDTPFHCHIYLVWGVNVCIYTIQCLGYVRHNLVATFGADAVNSFGPIALARIRSSGR